MKRFYCPYCKKIKGRLEVKGTDDTRFYWYVCKWCHRPVMTLEDALEKLLSIHYLKR